jgi:hypothetical protein
MYLLVDQGIAAEAQKIEREFITTIYLDLADFAGLTLTFA